MGEELGQFLLFVITDDGQDKLNELSPGFDRGAVGRRDVIEILLTVHKGEMKLPELLRANAGNLGEGVTFAPIRTCLTRDRGQTILTANAIS